MRKTSRAQQPKQQMSDAELMATVAVLPGGWNVRAVMGQHIRLRWVARRSVLEKDEDTGDMIETRQFESAVDSDDLIERLHRRNQTLGLEIPAKREEVALSA